MRALALVILLLIPAAAIAQDDLAQRQALARDYVQFTTADAIMGPMVDAIWPGIEGSLRGGNPSSDQAIFDELKAAFAAELKSALTDVLDEIAGLYAETFTLEELTAIMEFYRSPAGTKLIESQGELMQAMLPTLTARLQSTLPGAMQKVLEKAEEQGLKIN